jgi:hypothetical protein
MLEELTAGYDQALMGKFDGRTENERPKLIRGVLQRAVRRRWRHLAKERIENVTPAIPLGRWFWALAKSERGELNRLFADEDVRELITSTPHIG